MELTFAESLFVCWILFFGLWALFAIINVIGIGIMRVLDRRTGKKKWYIDGRCL